MSSSRRKACSAVTTTPGRQITPLDEPRDSVSTATAHAAALAVACANELESSISSADIFYVLHEQDAAKQGASTSANRLGSQLEGWLGRRREAANQGR